MAQSSASTTINVRVTEQVKEELEAVLDKMGLNISSAVNMFFRQVIMDEGLPFQPKVKHKRQSLKFYLENYYGKDIDTILKEREAEGFSNPAEMVDWGSPAGKEVW